MDGREAQALVREVLAGRRDAFRHLVTAFRLPLRSYIFSQIHSLDDADDVAQEVFIAAYRNLASFRAEEDFGAWLGGIARNKVLEHFRSAKRRKGAMGRFREQVAQRLAEEGPMRVDSNQTEQIEKLLLCVAKLPDRLRQVVRAGLDGDRADATAQRLNTTVGAVYALHYRANRLLRQCLSAEVS